jgi:hypothetical protein
MPGSGQHLFQALGQDKGRVADDVADLAALWVQEVPSTVSAITESKILIAVMYELNNTAMGVDKLAPEVLVLNVGTNVQVDSVERAGRTGRGLFLKLESGIFEGCLSYQVSIAEIDADRKV